MSQVPKGKPERAERASQSKLAFPPALDFKGRESKELIIAFAGPLGCGISHVIEEAGKVLHTMGYNKPVRIKLSEAIAKLIEKSGATVSSEPDVPESLRDNRYITLQDQGNALREHYKRNDVLARVAVTKIGFHRKSEHREKDVREIVPNRNVYFIDQLKHPDEVRFLKKIYGNLFFLVGVLCTYDQRKARLLQESKTALKKHEAEFLIKRDQRQAFNHGQRLDSTLQLADFFIRNNYSNRDSLATELKRFFELIHGKNGITPTQHEHAMYAAFAAAGGSACLSRQVGAAITNEDGNIISVGRNDVPKAGGGLYDSGDGHLDRRCVKLEGGKCFNDYYKNRKREEIENQLTVAGLVGRQAKDIAEKIYESAKLGDLLEFSRSIHAELDAIVAVARHGGPSTVNKLLYTTTFPCHNCARHIIAAGIKKVFYIEPYEKSLASDLHGEDIDTDPVDVNIAAEKVQRVQFIHFEGVAPAQYLNFFKVPFPRKRSDGTAMDYIVDKEAKVIGQLLDAYTDLETKVAEELRDTLNIDPEILAQ